MRKKIMALILILVLSVTLLSPLSPTLTVSADSYRSGISIVPEKENEAGVDPESGFILTSEQDITLEEVKSRVSFRDEAVSFTVTPLAKGRFLLKPTQPLGQNRVYFIDVQTKDGRTVSFAFQTKRDFMVLGSLPASMTSEVPLDTGIEIYFSYPDVQKIDQYFEITPKVEGRFESNGYTTVFIPKKLEPATLYTVRIKKGLTTANGAATLAEDYVFSFETSSKPGSTADPYPGSLYVNNAWMEFGTQEKPAVGFDLYLRQAVSQADVTLKAYRFKTLDDFIKAIRDKEQVPSWAPYATMKGMIPTGNLDKVMEFTQRFDLTQWQAKYMFFPETLPQGYYLIELSHDKLVSQAFLQISDVAAYSVSDKARTVFWLNDLVTGYTVKDAEIYDLNTGNSQKTDAAGLAALPATTKTGNGDLMTQDLYRVTTVDGKQSLINTGYSYDTDYTPTYLPNYNEGLYWRYMQTDRTLYKPDDTVHFWGFIKSRVDGKIPGEVTVELSNGGYYYPMTKAMSRFMPFLSQPLEALTLKTSGGFYEGSMALPALDPGYYTLTVKAGDEVLSSTYFNVENYIKPQYKIEITSDKKAVFVGEPITFTVKASFFDGTPVSNVSLNYNIHGYSSSERGLGTTDAQGVFKVQYVPDYTTDMQGQCYYSIYVNANFPETGDVTEYYSFYVFANDMTYWAQNWIEDNKGIVNVSVSAITLDSLNDDDPNNDNYVGHPIAQKNVRIKLIHSYYEKIEVGDTYDPINKVVRKNYEYREKRNTLYEATVTTDKDGAARYEFPVDPKAEGNYIAEISLADSKNRTIKGEQWIYKSGMTYQTDYEYYTLNTDKEAYRANEPVNAQVFKNEKPMGDAPTLFVESRNGIQSYWFNLKPSATRRFPESYAPNYYLDAIIFTGKSYVQAQTPVRYDYDEKKLLLEIRTDKSSYKPGDSMTISVKATDINGKPVPAKVNLSLVDEALLKLSNQYIDPLGQLYSWIGSGIIRNSTSRDTNYAGYGIRLTSGAIPSGSVTFSKNASMPAAQDEFKADQAAMAGLGSSTQVRSDFKDTALFKTITLDEKGMGTYTFKLPDNITSFKLAAAAVSEDLHAGSDMQSTRVTMPFFINDALSYDYLVGDKPYVGLSAYGEELKEGETVSFELTIKELPDYKASATAKAFERVNLALPALEEGTYTLVLSGKSASGLEDALSRTITVHSSYRTIEAAVLKALTPGTTPDAGKSGLTTLIFADAGRGSLIQALHNLSWASGKRLDQKLVANSARKLLMEIIKDESYWLDTIEVNPSDYRNEDGGYGILPYAGSDVSFTALIAPLLKEISDTTALKMYFYNALYNENKVSAAVLYGLAALGEPVLLDLNRASATENLTLEDYTLLALAYDALGDSTAAKSLYERKISPKLERKDPYIRVKISNNDTDASYKQTALVAVLASRLDSADAPKLFSYVENNTSKTQYVGVEKILYLKDQAQKLPDTQAAFTWTYAGRTETAELKNGSCEVLKIPSVKINELKITNVQGNVSVLSLYTAPYTQDTRNDSGVTIQRKYYNAYTGEETTTFKPNDLVKVEITYTIDKSAIDNTYELSDYCPAGLKPIDNPWSYGIRELMGCLYRQFDGQKVTFVIGKDTTYSKPLVYYARVASPGEYRVEGTVAQGSIVKSSIVTLEDATLTITP